MTSSPHVAVRTAAFAIVVIGVFAVLFLRLWFLQVLQGDDYIAQANANQERTVRVPAPRGSIVDADGKTLVQNRVAVVASLRASTIPSEDRTAILNYGAAFGNRATRINELQSAITATRKVPRGTKRADRPRVRAAQRERRSRLQRQRRAVPGRPKAPKPSATFVERIGPLSKLVRRSPRGLYGVVRDSLIRNPSANVALKANLSPAVRNEILQNARRYPGITVQRQYRREYPLKTVAAQIFGSVGQISPQQLRKKRFRGYVQGQIIGQSGLEAQYNDLLQGRDGSQRVQVDAQGLPTGAVRNQPARAGGKLQLTVQVGLQRQAQKLLADAVGSRTDGRTGDRTGGGLIAMDPSNGQVKAIASFPTFDPNRLQRRISAADYDKIFSARAGRPAFNRVTQSTYPTGSTFKIVTASAALAAGIINTSSTLMGGEALNINGQRFQNAGGANIPALPLPQALTVSSDVAFYKLGQQLYGKPGDPLQTWANRFRFGKKTGIDLPDESAGSIPSKEGIAALVKAQAKCEARRPKRTCNIALPGAGYYVGTAVQFAIGQGLAATPLQVATAYGALYDREGTTPDLHVPVPHLGLQELNAQGELVDDRAATRRRTVKFQASWKSAIKNGLEGVTRDPSGTGYGPFVGWNQKKFPILAKTGTAELEGQEDQAWFVAMVMDKQKPLVVAATVEGGGFGADGAAPMVCRVLKQYYGKSSGSAKCGTLGKAN